VGSSLSPFEATTTLWGLQGSYLNQRCGASKIAVRVYCHSSCRMSGIIVMFIENNSRWAAELTVLLIIKPTRCTNLSHLFLEENSACFRQFLCPSSGVFRCTHSNGSCRTCFANSLLTSCQQNLYDIYHCCVYSEKLLTMDRGTV